MPTIALSDQLKLVFEINSLPLTSLGKFLRSPMNLKMAGRIDAPPFQSVEGGLEFESPIDLGTDAVEMTAGVDRRISGPRSEAWE